MPYGPTETAEDHLIDCMFGPEFCPALWGRIWSGHLGVFRCPGTLGRSLAGTGWQFGADLHGEV